MLRTLTGFTPDSIEAAIHDRRLILFSPRLRTRNVLLSGFIEAPGCYLYTATPQDDTLAHFLSGLVEGLRDLAPAFGTQTLQALKSRKPMPDKLVDALVVDLGKL